MKTNKDYVTGPRPLWVGLGLGLVGGLAAGRWLAEPGRAHRLDLWQRLLAEPMGEVEAALFAARVQARYDELYAHRPRFTQRALRQHLKRYLLPALALYQVLRETYGDSQTALAKWDEVLGAPENSEMRKALALLSHLPATYQLFRVAVRWRLEHDFPPQGWAVEWIEDSDRRLAFNIRTCFYLKVLTAYGLPELTEHFCRLDDLAAEALPPSITWTRAGTLGRGQAVCDFCWSHVNQPNGASSVSQIGDRPGQ
jgi:hypothetical protein